MINIMILDSHCLSTAFKYEQSGNSLEKSFASSARGHEPARVQNVRDFPQTKHDSEINAPFLLNEHGDPHFLFLKFKENNILNN